MKIKFITFNNNKSAEEWRNELEKRFLSENEDLTCKINEIRDKQSTFKNPTEYYKHLHKEKKPRQEKWVTYLTKETAELFDKEIDRLKNEDAGDSKKTTIVAALPEFFWYDINDNKKHAEKNKNPEYIVNYHKPLYDDVYEELLCNKENDLVQLTEKYSNLIIFAGTAMHKKVIYPKSQTDDAKKTDDNKTIPDDKIFNTLLVYHTDKFQETTKHFVSTIDGFYNENGVLAKNKKGESEDRKPFIIDFNGLNFTADICLDFVKGKLKYKDLTLSCPMSTELNYTADKNVDINVLIAAGMPVYDYDSSSYIEPLHYIASDILLRCDGSYPPFGQIVNIEKNQSFVTNGNQIIQTLETEI